MTAKEFYTEYFGVKDPNEKGTTINESVFRFAEAYRDKLMQGQNLPLDSVIQRFMNSEVKIKVDEPTKKHLLKHIFIECGFEVKENKYTFEKGRFFWVEEGLFSSETKHLKNSMDLILRNRSKETVNLSDLNVV